MSSLDVVLTSVGRGLIETLLSWFPSCSHYSIIYANDANITWLSILSAGEGQWRCNPLTRSWHAFLAVTTNLGIMSSTDTFIECIIELKQAKYSQVN